MFLQELGERTEAPGERAEDQVHGRDGVGSEDQGLHARLHRAAAAHAHSAQDRECLVFSISLDSVFSWKQWRLILSSFQSANGWS